MKRKLWLATLGLGLGLGLMSGCQTWVPEAGVTMPSPHYLEHLPTYIPPSPPFPLSHEMESSIDAAARSRAAIAPVGALP